MSTPVVDEVELGGRYHVREPLGAGGMAQVFEAWDDRLGRPVAVKVLRPELACVTSLRRRFELEAQAAARLSHPNVVAVFDAGHDQGHSYIVMERLSGETLADVIARGPVDQAWLRRISVEVLSALGAAHAAGIIHRDIKPGNILLGPDGRAKVADFGIARVVEPTAEGEAASDSVAALTGVGLVLGTTSYLAPERARGEVATAQSDLYSLGVVMYEAITGVKPFAGSTPADIAAAATQRIAADPMTLRPDADPDLVAVIGKAMQPDPASRYPNAAAMAQDLWSPVAGATSVMPVAAGVAPERARTAVLAADGDGRVAIAAGGAGASLLSGRRAAAAGLAERFEPRTRRRALGVLGVAAAVLMAIVVARPATHSAASGTPAATGTTTATTAVVASAPPAVTQLRTLAAQVAGQGSAIDQQLSAALSQVAAVTDPTARASAASGVLAEATAWYQTGQITNSTYQQVSQALRAVGARPIAASAPARSGKHGGHGKNND